ncbi:MAG: hypothetical protein ABIG61_16605 [Planctomycetota bacterium]
MILFAMRYRNYFLLSPKSSAKAQIKLKKLGTCYWDAQSAFMEYTIHVPGGDTLARGTSTLDVDCNFQIGKNIKPLLAEVICEHLISVNFDKPFAVIGSKTSPLSTNCRKTVLYFCPSKKEKRISLTIQRRTDLTQLGDLTDGKFGFVRIHLYRPDARMMVEKQGQFIEKPCRISIAVGKPSCNGVWALHIEQVCQTGNPLDIFVSSNSTEPYFTLNKTWAMKFTGFLTQKNKYSTPPEGGIINSQAPLRIFARNDISKLSKKLPSREPINYVIDYDQNHLDNPEYIKKTRKYNADVLHFGKDVPMTHLWGPIAATGGENQAHGLNSADTRRLSPKEVRQRINTLTKMNKALHEAGTKEVMPYIAAITAAGDPGKRLGFFEFLDHWDEYREFGLGRNPKGDPHTWAARRKDGSFITWANGPLSFPRYAGMNRYVVCVNQPEWARWLKIVTTLVAKSGYDGTFVDNAANYECYCEKCQTEFRNYLGKKYSPNDLRELFGTSSIEKISIGTEEYTLLYIESKKFWAQSLRKLLIEMRNAGCTINPNFKLFPNLTYPYHMYPYLCDVMDYAMFEGGLRQFEGAGRVYKHIAGQFIQDGYQTNIHVCRYTASLPGKLKTLIIAHKTPRSKKEVYLGLGELSAYGRGIGDGSYWGRPWETEDQARKKDNAARSFFDFVKANKRLYEKNYSACEIGIFYWPWQFYYPANKHRNTNYLMDCMITNHIPFDCISEQALEKGLLGSLKYLFTVDVKYLTEEQLNKVKNFVSKGGSLIIMGDFATHDHQCRKRKTLPFASASDNGISHGKGKVYRFPVAEISDKGVTMILQATCAPDLAGNSSWPGLGCILYAKSDLRGFVLHLLNYNIPLNYGGEKEVQALGKIPIELTLPTNIKVSSVKYADVEKKRFKMVKHKQLGPQLSFTLPGFAAYMVCDIEIQ